MAYYSLDNPEEDKKHWFTTAPTAPQEKQDDVTTTHDIHYTPEGIPCCCGGDQHG